MILHSCMSTVFAGDFCLLWRLELLCNVKWFKMRDCSYVSDYLRKIEISSGPKLLLNACYSGFSPPIGSWFFVLGPCKVWSACEDYYIKKIIKWMVYSFGIECGCTWQYAYRQISLNFLLLLTLLGFYMSCADMWLLSWQLISLLTWGI
jgi:hypothetical protein